ncbi:hypothetical protein AVEN_35271-1 [Araneus ventricosus]|uniref:Uncharacterized protein n=1 Tax=Araneus ventricosus TaxID=182803 RepID=A0A4Y2EEP6_ARAVE|nr:hypothetical protein AVEN_35271-1 [Araneus ventricosus]
MGRLGVESSPPSIVFIQLVEHTHWRNLYAVHFRKGLNSDSVRFLELLTPTHVYVKTIIQKRNKLDKLNSVCGFERKIEDLYQISHPIGQRAEIHNAYWVIFTISSQYAEAKHEMPHIFTIGRS